MTASSLTEYAANLASRPARSRWLLLFNCQAQGLGHCLNMLAQDVQVEWYDPQAFSKRRDEVLGRLDLFERILVAPYLEKTLQLPLANQGNVVAVPHLEFHGFHPDLCQLSSRGKLRGPIGPYHSMICYAAFCAGMSERTTLDLFCEDVYQRLGYFDVWSSSRERMSTIFAQSGFDSDPAFLRWSRTGPFMYSINHPKIHCLRDMARMILKREDARMWKSDAVPHDNLANGPIFPVYPEIGARIGVEGSYEFKRAGFYELIGLDRFIAESFEVYRNPDAEVDPPLYFEQRLNAVQSAIRTIQ